MNDVVHIDDLEIEVRRSDRRRTVDLTVDRFGNLVIAVPALLQRQEIEQIIHRKQLWIYATLRRKDDVLHPQTEKQFVTGEGFYYLGKKYRLKVLEPDGHPGHVPSLELKNGRFFLQRNAAPRGREHFIKWYAEQGQRWIRVAVNRLKERVAAAPKSVGVRDLRFRWGSCTPNRDVYFHWRVILLPPSVIHYLILHELVHLHEHHHNAAFYKRLGQAAPDFIEMERWLEKNGDRYTV